MQRERYLEGKDVIVDWISCLQKLINVLRLTPRKRTTCTIHLCSGTVRFLNLGQGTGPFQCSVICEERFCTATKANCAKVRNVPSGQLTCKQSHPPDAGKRWSTASRAHTLLHCEPPIWKMRTHEQQPPNTSDRMKSQSTVAD